MAFVEMRVMDFTDRIYVP